VGGFFTNINGSTRYCIARLLPDGTLDPNWNPAANSTVYALAVSGTNVYAGGYFTRIGSFSRGCIARLSAGGTGAVDATWNPNATDVSYSPYIDTIAVSDTNVYVGGYFTSIGGQARNSIAKLTAVGTGTADAAWNPNAGAGAYTVLVDATVVSGTNLYVGGYFTSIGGQARNCLARLSLSGSGAADATWNPNALGEVFALAVSGTDLYAGGAFGTIGNLTRNSIAKLSTGGTGATDPAWNPNADSEVDSIALEGTYVYAGGSFTNIGGMHRNSLAKLTSSGAGGADATWEADANDVVDAVAPGRTNLYVAGAFTQIGGQPRGGVASLAFAPFKLGSPRYSGTQFQLTVTSEKGLCFEIQASTNLVDWTPISTLTNGTGVTNCTDPILNLPRRFYRAHQLQ
jgi:hypothetical protein